MPEFVFTVNRQDEGTRLDIYLYQQILAKTREISRTNLQKLIQEGNVKVNHALTKPHHKVRPAEVITIKFETENPSASLKPHALPLEIIYQDKYLAVINKPVGLVVHAGAGNQPFTLANVLLHHFKNLSTVNPERPGIVHRLDKDTSGLMVIARDNQTHLALAKDFARHNIKRKR
jgi:23S rRNA pseudouridine1911/1915/1917 synthase